MKNLMITVVLVLGFNFVSFAQEAPKTNSLHFDAEVENELSDSGKLTPDFKGYLTYGGKTKVGGYCWIQIEQHWREFYCGPTLQAKSWLQVGAAIGAQTGSKHFQAGAFAWVGHKVGSKFVQNLFLLEKVDLWYRNTTTVSVTNKVDLSVATQKFRGTGPLLDYKLTKKLSVGAEYDFAKNSTLAFGFKYRL